MAKKNTGTGKINKTFSAVSKANPGFDIVNFDFHRKSELENLNFGLKAGQELKKEALVSDLKALQRMMRICQDQEVAEKLISIGLDSAQKVASLSRRKFMLLAMPIINDEEQLDDIYTKAVHVRELTYHLYGNIKDTTASPHYQATSFKVSNTDDDNYYKGIPSYQDIFGSLNYLECDECSSIFSPAAYFLDIMRITDEYISEPNMIPLRTIPPGYALEERRPDLFDMELNCANTNTVIPYLQLVNEILRKNLERTQGVGDAIQKLAVGNYPFQLPFILPLAKTEAYLEKMSTSLAKIFQSLLTTDTNPANVHAFDVALASLNISFQQYKIISKEDFTVDGLTSAFGYNIEYQPQPYTGTGRLLFLKNQKLITGVGSLFTTKVTVNDTILVADEIKTVTKINSDTELTVNSNLSVTSGSVYTVKPRGPVTSIGTGTMSFYPKSVATTGNGTVFTTQLQIGDTIVCEGETRIIVAIESDTKLTVNESWSFLADESNFSVTKDVKAEVAGKGMVSFYPKSKITNGTGTSFTSEIAVGDQIQCDGERRTVASIESDTKLTVDQDWTFLCDEDTFKILKQDKPDYIGQGAVVVTNGESIVKGMGTNFTVDFISGSAIRINGITRSVLSVQSETSLTIDGIWDFDLGTFYRVTPQPALKKISAYLPFTGKGTLTVEKTSVTVTGKGTKFKSEIALGDQIKIDKRVRTVISITSDTQLTVASTWGIDSANAAFTIFPSQGLDVVDNFISRTNFTRPELERLFVQDLSPEELKSEVANNFFINDTKESIPYLQTYFIDDPDNPVQRIDGVSLKRLDRLHRFIRLQQATGWTSVDLNWLFTTSGSAPVTAINEELIIYLSKAKVLQLSIDEISIPEMTAFWADIKTIGKIKDKSPKDLFDVIYNNPILLHGKDPYVEDVPFNPFKTPVMKWVIDSITGMNAIIADRLSAALYLDTADVVLLGNYVISLTGGSEKTLSLNLKNLTWLYRISQWASRLSITIDELMVLLCLQFYPDKSYLNPPANSIAPTPETYGLLNEVMKNLHAENLTIYQLNYILKGETGPHYEASYAASDIPEFVNQLATAAISTKLNHSDFVFDNIDAPKASFLYSEMIGTDKYISANGIFYRYSFLYNDAANFYPVTSIDENFISAFHSDTFALSIVGITVEQSKAVFEALHKNDPAVLILLATGSTILAETFSEKTDLSFLEVIFDKETAKLQVSKIQAFLLQTQSSIFHTLKVWRDTLQEQQTLLDNWLSIFLNTVPSTIKSMKTYVSDTVKLKYYLVTFLTHIEKADSGILDFVKVMNRNSMLMDALSFTEKEMVYLTSPNGAVHFNIINIQSLTVANFISLINYRKLVQDFGDVNDELITYFKLPKDTGCPGIKIEKLSAITGWTATQICELISLFWPIGADSIYDYDTVAGLLRLKAAFNTGNEIGADMQGLISFRSIAHLDLDPNGAFSQTNWDTYENQASKTMSLTGSRYNETGFEEVNTSVQGSMNSQTRDALMPFSIWIINATNPGISKPSDLYGYLLIDVEMSGCAQTSRIAQGISTVQLYMQRSRMMLEQGVNIIDVPKIWWEWMSSYRIWEVNRKIYLYPENYIEPTLRKKATPPFKQFSEALLQNDINKSTVKAPYQQYLQEVNTLGSLVHIASYNTTRKDALTGEPKETLFLFGRTNTQPYIYYMRKLDDMEDWGPWLKIDIAINGTSITPVYALDRIFIFWSEKGITQSSEVTEQESKTQTVELVDLKFSFYDETSWVHPQIVASKIPINAFPSNYPSIENEQINEILDDKNSYWNIPYVLSTGKGFLGKDRVEIKKDSKEVIGKKTQFLRQIGIGDTIWCMGESRIVEDIVSNTKLTVTRIWSISEGNCEYKIIPRTGLNQAAPFVGVGTVSTSTDILGVDGFGTKFTEEFSVGDNIVVGTETRMIIGISSDVKMIIENEWTINNTKSPYTVSPLAQKGEQLILLLGGNLPNSYSKEVKAPVVKPNPTKNQFIEQRDTLNNDLYRSLQLAKYTGPQGLKIPGNVSFGPVEIINSNLLKTESYLTLTDYQYAAASNPKPFRADLDRQQANMVVMNDTNPILNNYWGNNIAGTANNSGVIQESGTRKILYNADSEKSSLINVSNQTGWFIYDNSDEAFLVRAQQENLIKLTEMAMIRPYPMLPDMLNNKIISTQAFSTNAVNFNDLNFKFTRLTTHVTSVLMQKLFAGGIDNLLTLRSQEIPELPFNRFYPAPGNVPAPGVIPPDSELMDFNGSFGIYFWEIFFHGPFLVADILNMNNKFEDAKQWLEYIFNPTVNEDDSANPDPEKRFWRFRPFRSMDQETLTEILTNPAQIRRYNYDPFDPDAIARYRHVAYAKAVVMKYIDNLLNWGDHLFAQDTSESINQATNLYVLASDLLGKRPESQGKIPNPKPKTFNDIRNEYSNHIPQFLIELENTPHAIVPTGQTTAFSSVPFNKIDSYFCVPENTDFMEYWDKVEDRLYKIRHCQNIEGIFRQLSLFGSPLDPRAFIRAFGANGGGFATASSFSAPLPFFKFSYLVDKARMLTSQVSNLGSSLLAALEKKDGEDLNRIRLQQEMTVLQLTTTIKELQIDAIKEQQASLKQSLDSTTYRYDHYTSLIKEGISTREQVSMDASLAAVIINTMGAIAKTAASIGYAVPQVGSPFAMTYGGAQIGNALNAASGAFEIGSIISNYVSQQALTMAGYDRREQDWTLQRKTAEYDKAQIEAQMKETEIQLQIAQQELVVHQQNIKNDQELEAYYKDKFTTPELYKWLATRISNIYFQSYTLAFNMAKAAERALQFQSNSERNYINFGYWDNLYKGLGAADGLMLALDQMESNSILETGSRNLEIEKTISLLQLNPKALLDLKTKGECIFEFNEKLFDYDFPGHYSRKIKTVSISVPAIIGPYQNINASLTQLSNQVVLKSDAQGLVAVNYLLGGDVSKIPDSSVLRSNWWINQQVALSRGVNDNGMFELNFDDNRFLPFEGTGAVSIWKLSMPLATNRINFDSISDVVVQLKYTAKDGGDKFRKDVMALTPFKSYSGVGYLNIHQTYPQSWFNFMKDHTNPLSQSLNFALVNFVQPNIKKAKLIGFYIKLDATVAIQGANYVTFNVAPGVSVVVPIGVGNDCSYFFKKNQEPTIDKVLGERSITFDLKTAPSVLLDKEKFLDPAILTNIQLILYYDGLA